MKKLIPFWPVVVIVVLSFITMCNPKEKKPPPVVTPPVTQIHLGDSVLENKDMDNYSQEVNARRKPPRPKPHPNDPPLPPVTPANGCLLLDFNGHNVTGTMWNTGGAFTCASANLTPTNEQVVFDKVVSYYAVFNPYIKITRDEAVFNSYPQNKRRRIIITTSWEWFGSSGGVAYINSFSWFDDTPAFVFSSLLGYNTKNIADATAHEGGHTLGCRHQSDWRFNADSSCYKASDYFWGNKIMGASYNDANPQWSIGPNSLGCTIIQNDTTVILETLRR